MTVLWTLPSAVSMDAHVSAIACASSRERASGKRRYGLTLLPSAARPM